MLHAAIRVVLYGLLAGFTGFGFAATLTGDAIRHHAHGGAQGDIGRRQPQVTVYALPILAALLVLDAASVLLM